MLSWTSRWSISAKLAAGFMILALGLASMGVVAVDRLAILQSNAGSIYADELLPIGNLATIDYNLQRIRQTSFMMFTPVSAETARGFVENAHIFDLNISAQIVAFRKANRSAKTAAAFDRFVEAYLNARAFREGSQYPALLRGDREAGFQAVIAGSASYEAADLGLVNTRRAQEANAQLRFEDSVKTYLKCRQLLIGLIISGVVIAVALGLLIARAISRPLQQTVLLLEAVAQGDLSRARPDRPDRRDRPHVSGPERGD